MNSVGAEKDKQVIDAMLKSDEDQIKRILQATSLKRSSANIGETCASEKNVRFTFKRKIITVVSIAACLSGLFFAGMKYHDYSATVDLGEKYSESFNTTVIVRGQSEEKTTKELSDLFSDVRNGRNIDKCIKQLENFWNLSYENTYNDYTDYSSEIGWNLAIAYLKNNDRKSALVVLQKLVNNSESGSKLKSRAIQLIKEINAI